MRILIATKFRSQLGGVERYLQRLIPGLLAHRHEIALVYGAPLESSTETIDPPGQPLQAWCLAQDGLTKTLKSVEMWKPELVYFHEVETQYGDAFEEALLAAYPVVQYLHNYDRTCLSGNKCFSFPSRQGCARRFGPACLVMYFPRRCGGLHPGTMFRMYSEHRQRHARLASYKAILVASNWMHSELQRNGVESGKLHLVRYPMTDVAPQPQAPEPRAPGGRLLFLGRLTPLKGVDYLIRALPLASRALNRRLTLTVAGEGPALEDLRRLAAELNAPVEFFGWADTSSKIRLIRAADLQVVPSIWPEPFGLVGIESGCYGVPSAGFAVGGITDWLMDGENGYLASGDSPSVPALAQAIHKVLSSPAEYSKLSAGAWNIAKRYTLETHLAQLEAVFDGVKSGVEVQPVEDLRLHKAAAAR